MFRFSIAVLLTFVYVSCDKTYRIATTARQAGELLVQAQLQGIEKSLSPDRLKAFFMAPAAGLEPAT
jgi:hypothetical protein